MTAGVAYSAPPSLARQSFSSSISTAFSVRESIDEMQPANLDTTLIDPLSGSGWDDLLSTHPGATIFHTSAWARVLARTYGHRPFYLHLTRGGSSVALLPLMEVASRFTGRRGVCLPFSDFCAPLLFDDSEADALGNKVHDLAAKRKWNHVELRGVVPAAAPDPAVATFYGHALDLAGGEEALFARFNSSVHRAIRKAEKSGVTIDILRTPEAMREFYRLHCQTRRRHGAPPQPISFFQHIQEEIIDSGLAFVALARLSARPVGAALFFHWRKKALFKFGASDHRSLHLRPNHLVMWEAIKLLIADGVSSLHFGRTAPDNDGLRRFKLSWGATEEPLAYLRFNPSTRLVVPMRQTISSAFHQKIFAKLPLALSVLAGKLLYPHLD